MSTKTRWLALLFLGACGTTASAQAPFMYGPQPAPSYPYYQPMPYYPAPQYQPQPRVLYVSATAPSWDAAPAPQQPAIVPVQNAVRPVPALEASGGNRSAAFDTDGLGPKSTDVSPAAKTVPAKTASLQKDGVVERVTSVTYGPEIADPHAAGVVDPSHDCTTNWLPKGVWDLQCLGSAYADIGSARYNWIQTTFRLGKVWTGECLEQLPGGFESLIEINGATTVENDFGNYFYGGGLLLRYNFVKLGSRLVPYTQIGVGAQYNDAYKNHDQQFLGSPVELTAQAQLGCRLFLSKYFSLDIEGGIQYLANLNMSNRDGDITALGGSAGLTFFFPCACRR